MKHVALVGARSKQQVEVAEYLASHDTQIKVVAVTDKDARLANELAQRFGAKSSGDLSSVLKDTSVNLVCVDLPFAEKTDAILQCAEAGKSILCLAPLASTLKDTKEIIDAVTKNQVRLFSPFVHRNNPHLAAAKALVKKEGRELSSIHCSIKKSGSNDLLLDPGAVTFDFVRWYTGYGINKIYCQTLKSDDKESVAAMIGWLENGALLSIDIACADLDEMVCEALYSDALLLLTPTNQSVHVDLAGARRLDYPNIESLRYAIEEVVAGVASDAQPAVPYKDIEMAAALVEQARLSAKEGKPVKPKV